MKVYISGKISGDPNYKQKFEAAESYLKSIGYEPVNPCKGKADGESWEWYMKQDLKQMLDCDGVYCLEDWHESTGASLEVSLASELKLKIMGAEWGAPEKLA